MFTDVAQWLGGAVARLDLPKSGAVLDVGSSTHRYRTVEQPHVDERIFAPLRARGLDVVHLDVKAELGVDVVCDLDASSPADVSRRLGREFDLVLCLEMLIHVRDPRNVLAIAARQVAPGGWLVLTTARRHRRTLDPRDNMMRLRPRGLARMARASLPELTTVEAATIRIDDPRYYGPPEIRLRSRMPVASRFWVPMPRFTDGLRLRVPPLRWSVAAAVLRRAAWRRGRGPAATIHPPSWRR